MADSEWESINKKVKNRIIYSIGVGIPVLLLCGFFIYNNWDIISTKTPEGERKIVDTDEVQQARLSSAENNGTAGSSGMMLVDSQGIPSQSHNVSAAISELQQVAENERFDSQSEKDILVTNRTVSSLVISSIKCHTSDRNDLLLFLSVQLLSDIPVLESRVLVMRNEFKVIIQKIVRNSEFSLLNKELLKNDIIKSVNEYTGKEIFKDMKFTEFNIEKVTGK
ncbi:MAG: hypothetical protein JW915_12595 [Chitinispirillaceae bacterium]|nr:hypothetical protein [Chitinispirillaceae bacterium]